MGIGYTFRKPLKGSKYSLDDENTNPKQILLGILEQSPTHGLSKLTRPRGSFRKILWGFTCISLVISSFVIMTLSSANYMARDVRVKVEIKTANRQLFPAVTVCNLNPIKASALGQNEALSNILGKKRRKKRTGSGCPNPEEPESGKCFFLLDSSTITTWDGAKSLCETNGATLASFTTQAMVDHIIAHDIGENIYWINMKTGDNRKGYWQFASGAVVETVEYWDSSDSKDRKKCVIAKVSSNHKWATRSCSTDALVMCEKGGNTQESDNGQETLVTQTAINTEPTTQHKHTTNEVITTTTQNIHTSLEISTHVDTTVLPSTENVKTTTPPTSTKIETTVLPSTENMETTTPPTSTKLDTTALPSTENMETTTPPITTKIETTALPSTENVETTTPPITTKIETTALPSTENVETTTPPITTKIETTALPSTENVETTTPPTSTNIDTTSETLSTTTRGDQTTPHNEDTTSHSTTSAGTTSPTATATQTFTTTVPLAIPDEANVTSSNITTDESTTQIFITIIDSNTTAPLTTADEADVTTQHKTTKTYITTKKLVQTTTTNVPTTTSTMRVGATTQKTFTTIKNTPSPTTTRKLVTKTSTLRTVTEPTNAPTERIFTTRQPSTGPQPIEGSSIPGRVAQRDDFMKEEKVFEVLANMDTEVKKKLSYKATEFILDCQYVGIQCDISAMSEFYNNHHGNCYSFNSGWNKTHEKEYANKDGRKFALQLVINVGQDEYLPNMGDAVGAKVIVHPYGTMPHPDDEGYMVDTGKLISIALQKVIIQKIPEPYGNCAEKDPINLDVYAEHYPVNYSVMGCYKTCYQKHVIKECGCALADVPMTGASLNWPNISTCDKTNVQDGDCVYIVTEKYITDKLSCHCPINCRNELFLPEVSTSTWPNDKTKDSTMKRFGDIGKVMLENDKYKKNLLKLEVYFKELSYKVLTEVPSYSAGEFASDLGGTVSLWIGASSISVMEWFECGLDMIVLGIIKIIAKHKRKQSIDDTQGS